MEARSRGRRFHESGEDSLVSSVNRTGSAPNPEEPRRQNRPRAEEVDSDLGALTATPPSSTGKADSSSSIPIAPFVPEHPSPQSLTSSDKNKSSTTTTPEGRSVLLTTKEVKALKQGLEMATPSKDTKQIKEEEEEKRAADLEKKKRASQVNMPSTIGSDPPMRRFKILLLGDSGVGKTSLIYRWTLDSFNPSLSSTVGVDFKAKKVVVSGEATQIQVWDTAGQEQFHKITTSYYRGAQGIMLVCDVSDPETIENITYWMKNIINHASDSIRVVLVGNKTDLRALHHPEEGSEGYEEAMKKYEDLEAHAKKARDIAERFNVPYIETSAKDSNGVDEAFLSLVNFMICADHTQVYRPPGRTVPGGDKAAGAGGKDKKNIFGFSKKAGSPQGTGKDSGSKGDKEKCTIM